MASKKKKPRSQVSKKKGKKTLLGKKPGSKNRSAKPLNVVQSKGNNSKKKSGLAKPLNKKKEKSKKKSDKKIKKKSQKGKKMNPISLVLTKWLYSFFGFESFEDFKNSIKIDLDWDEENSVEDYILQNLRETLVENAFFSEDDLIGYSDNIRRHTLEISEKREHFEGWKYFQFLSLVFTEIYLHQYMKNATNLLRSLNEFLLTHNEGLNNRERLQQYTYSDLNLLAFWNATGSGKTLLMHVNLKQFLYYYKKYERKDINQVILLTPNAALSRQHLEEFKLSGITANLFQTGTRLYKEMVQILDIHKLEETQGETTIAVDSLETNNLVLVDEGHRGAKGEKWMDMRKRISETGFSFEYSATFGQIITSNNEMYHQYSKNIIFDYSYKYFYYDGYGKDFLILNLRDQNFLQQRNPYLTASILTFFEQIMYYKENQTNIQEFNLEYPLMILVGSTVIGSKKNENGKATVSDLVEFVNFLKWFLSGMKEVKDTLSTLLSSNTGLLNPLSQDLFADKFQYLKSRNLTTQSLYSSILKDVFHTETHGVELHLDNLKGNEGEIGLRAGENDYFGVINIGEVKTFLDICEEVNLTVGERDYSDSLFESINHRHSKINFLIGSKKFMEGWNSWRVSCMGLLNIGKKEGTQIIQLFGRGVRLRGYNFSLKRSRFLPIRDDIPVPPLYMHLLETLNIFGINANYIQKFKEYIESEGLSQVSDTKKITLPVLTSNEENTLKIISLKKETHFSKNSYILSLPNESEKTNFLIQSPIILNWYTRLQGYSSTAELLEGNEIVYEEYNFQTYHLPYINMNRLYFDLIDFKKRKGFMNLLIEKNIITQLLLDTSWYKVQIPKTQFILSSIDKEYTWYDIANTLLQKYVTRYYYQVRDRYEKDFREIVSLSEHEKRNSGKEKNGNLFKEYEVTYHSSEIQLESYLLDLKKLLEGNNFEKLPNYNTNEIIPFILNEHIYKPILFKDENLEITINPPAITTPSEKEFLNDLKLFINKNQDIFKSKKIRILRNLGRGRGVSFFEAGNFYPDFIMWIVDSKKQYICFIDPKGLVQIHANHKKLQFYKLIKETEDKLKDKDIQLESFILSKTRYTELRKDMGYTESQSEMEKKHIFFMSERKDQLYIHKMLSSILPDFPKPKIESVLQFVLDFKDKMYKSLLPVYSFRAACGKFGNAEEVTEEGWVEVNSNLNSNLFIARAVGRSMEPKIYEGEYIVFEKYSGGSRQDLLVLAKCITFTDPDTSSSFTIKKYHRTKKKSKNSGWEHESIELIPLNPDYDSILLEKNDTNEQVEVIAFVKGKYDLETCNIIGLKD